MTILRPVKGLEPCLYECLASTFRQTYPREKLTIYFCVSSSDDPAFPILKRLVADFPSFDVKIFVEEEDPNLSGCGGRECHLGPNPKLRNMSRGYREAKGDILWIIDCNVWVGKGVAGRMVDKLCGITSSGAAKKYKFVHQLPLVVDVDGKGIASTSTASYAIQQPPAPQQSLLSTITHRGGGRLEELFLSSSHAKFYTAINTVLMAPCIIGKSNMFRRSHLDHLTATNPRRAPGIDFFSDNICEDHLIGDLLWKNAVPDELAAAAADIHPHPGATPKPKPAPKPQWGKHALLFGDLAIQPMAAMSVHEYVARRVRWLRVRKYTVVLATLVEPGTESFACSAAGAFAVSTHPWCHGALAVPQTWLAFALFWLLSVAAWAAVDRSVYGILQSAASVEVDEHTPAFARPPEEEEGGCGRARRPLGEWLLAWVGREVLAGPVWVWAVFGGGTVVWRGERFWVGVDMRVHAVGGREEEKEMRDGGSKLADGNGLGLETIWRGGGRTKWRRD